MNGYTDDQCLDTMDKYASGAAKGYVAAPGTANYTAGVIPKDTLPAKWWNWFMQKLTENEALTSYALTDIYAELNNVLTSGGQTADNTTHTQLYTAIKQIIDSSTDVFIPQTDKGIAGGVATLDSTGRVPTSQLTLQALELKGTWDPTTGTAPSTTMTTGDFWIVTGAADTGTVWNNITWHNGDWIVYDGTNWICSTNSNLVQSVNGYTGTVQLNPSASQSGCTLTIGLSGADSASVNITCATNANTATLATNATNATCATCATWAANATNATCATKLATARTINGVSFDGSANITVTDSTKAPLASPAFTGTPTAPTPETTTNDTQIATTAFVKNQKYEPNQGTGNGSLALGSAATAIGSNSTAVGLLSKASESFSTAFGRESSARGPYSTALGYGAGTLRDHQISIGNKIVYFRFATTATEGEIYSALSPLLNPTTGCYQGAMGSFGGHEVVLLHRLNSTTIELYDNGNVVLKTIHSENGNVIGSNMAICMITY